MTNETFYELMTPSIPTERASVRIHTTPEMLDAYIKHKESLKVGKILDMTILNIMNIIALVCCVLTLLHFKCVKRVIKGQKINEKRRQDLKVCSKIVRHAKACWKLTIH